MQIPINIEHSFCAAKWLMVTMHFGMGENHSCYHPPIHAWKPEEVAKSPSALHNTEHKIKQREMMLGGIRPKECNYCWNMEDIDPTVVSDRKRFTNETWAIERRQEILEAPAGKHIGPAYMEISFANVCNFACSYCSPGQSSTWEHEVRKYGSYPIEDPTVHKDKMHDMIPEDNNPYIDAFWQWLPEVYKDLRYLRITGGEPLATRNFMKLLDYVAANKNKDLTLVINTNLCVPEKNLDLFFTKAKALQDANTIKGIEVYTSMDTWGKQAEYIRDGLDIVKWEETVRKVSSTFGVPIRVMVTFGLLSVFNFQTFVEKVIQMRADGIDIMFNCSRLVDPKQFDLRILPDSADEYFTRVNAFIVDNGKIVSVEHETWAMVYQFWRARYDTMSAEERAHRKDQFAKFTAEYDKRRELNFKETFPELAEWI
jgi:organic radical activating enzyme